MKKITAIEPQKKNPDRLNIFLDDSFAFGLSKLSAAWLQVGQSLSDEKIGTLQAEDSRELAMQKALHYLSYRARSQHEIRTNLAKADIPEEGIAATLARLMELNLVNDAEFAKAWIEDRQRFRPRSKRFLAYELKQKGISGQVSWEALEARVDDATEALNAARKISRRLQGLDNQEFRNKLGGYLGRRGFGYAAVAPAIKTLWEEIHPSDELINFDDEDIL